MCTLSSEQLLTWRSLFFFFWLYIVIYFYFLTEFRNDWDTPIFIEFCCEDYTLTYRSLLSAGMNHSWTQQHRWGSKQKWKASKTTCHLLYIILPFSCSCSPKYPEYSLPYSTEAADSLMNPGLVILYRRAQHISNISSVRRQALSSSVLFGTETTLSWFCGPFVSFPPSRLEARRLTNEPNSCWAVPATRRCLSRVTRGWGWLGRRVLADLFTSCL